MRKLIQTSVMAFIFLTISSLTSFLIPNSVWEHAIIPLGIGLIIIITSIIISLIAKKLKNLWVALIPFFTNSVGLGLCLDAWYVDRGFENELYVMLLVSLASVSALWIFYAFLYIPFFNEHYKLYLVCFIILGIIGYICLVANTKTTYVSTFGYYLIVSTGFLLAMSFETNSKYEFIHGMSLSTYSIIIVAIIILIIILLGDGIDGDIPVEAFTSSDEHSYLKSPRKQKKSI